MLSNEKSLFRPRLAHYPFSPNLLRRRRNPGSFAPPLTTKIPNAAMAGIRPQEPAWPHPTLGLALIREQRASLVERASSESLKP